MNILLTDILFPNKYAKWRLVEIKSFIDEYKCDILVVNKITNYAGIKYDFDYEILKEKFSLEEYDILIFNKNYNFVNKYRSSIDVFTKNNDMTIRECENGNFIVYYYNFGVEKIDLFL